MSNSDNFIERHMANLSGKTTGIHKGVVTIFTKEPRKKPGLKFYIDKPGEGNLNVTCFIKKGELEFSSHSDSDLLTRKQKLELEKFININYKRLMYYWEKAFYILDDKLIKFLKGFKKV